MMQTDLSLCLSLVHEPSEVTTGCLVSCQNQARSERAVPPLAAEDRRHHRFPCQLPAERDREAVVVNRPADNLALQRSIRARGCSGKRDRVQGRTWLLGAGPLHVCHHVSQSDRLRHDMKEEIHENSAFQGMLLHKTNFNLLKDTFDI